MLASLVQWGDVGTWVAGLATAAAFIVTASVFSMQLRDRRREDARQVSAWINLRQLRSESPQYQVKCRNGSAEPIFSVAIVLGDLHQGKGVIVNVIGPKSTMKTWIKAPTPLLVDKDGNPVGVDPPVHIRFTDSAGRRWGRRSDGRLIRRHVWRNLPESQLLERLVESAKDRLMETDEPEASVGE